MKADIGTLKDTFKISYDSFESSRIEAREILDLYHNRHYTSQQVAILENRGQPKETFNVVKMFGRMLLGYYSTVVNAVKAMPAQPDDTLTAQVLNDMIDYTFRDNHFGAEGDKIKLDCILTGLMVSYVDVQPTGEKDEFGRPKYRIEINHVPSLEVALDPMSMQDDYSDARFIHRFKWISEDQAIKLYGKAKIKELDEYSNFLNIEEAEFEETYNTQFNGHYKVFNNYLVVHTIITDSDDRTWSVFWSNETILSKTEITYKEVKNPYRVHKLHNSNRSEYYGIFREVKETQHAINQALVKIQLMVNTQKAFVQEGAVENLANFIDQFNRVNAVIPVKDLQGIRIENLTREVMDQYTIIDKGLDRIQRMLSINDSFLGMAYASDSGAKVRLQQNASIVALRYVTSKVEQFYRLLGWDIASLIKQYYTFHDVLRIADSSMGQRWVEINKPMEIPVGMDSQGQMVSRPIFEEVVDPATGEVMTDEDGTILMAPIPTRETEIQFTRADITVESVAYNDEEEKAQVILEQFINGPVGQMLMQVNPVGYFKAAELAIKNTKTKYSLDLSEILQQTAQMLGGNPAAQQQMMAGAMPGQMGMGQAVNNQGGRPMVGGE